jgi:DNA-binding CsgD family transcriptional regulator
MSKSSEQSDGTVGHARPVGTVAWIDLHPGLGPRPTGDPSVGTSATRYALRQIGRAVRADDRVCPIGIFSVVVEFGSAARAVPLHVLGGRLVRAIGPRLPFDHRATGLTVAVGIAAPGVREPTGRIAHRARSAARSSVRALHPGAVDRSPITAAVTVDEPVARCSGPPRTGAILGLRRRSAHRYGTGRVDSVPAFVPMVGIVEAATAGPVPGASGLSVLVVDPMATENDGPGFPTLTAAAVAQRLGCRTVSAAAPATGPSVTTVDGVDVDLVILVLDGAWVGRSPSWTNGPWGLPARLTTEYVDKGIPVLAVGAGAGAGALAACVAQGALVLFSLDRLADALQSLDRLSIVEASQVAELGFPNRFRALLELTAGERRILFYLTEGWAAQDIADELVVSLTTVRSHIRSVLRKLEVRSQLAAVAIANSRDLEHHQVTAHA